MNGLVIVTAPDTGDEWELRGVDDDGIDSAIVAAFRSIGVPPATLDVCGDHGYIGPWRWDGDDAWRADECPTCTSTAPNLHPALAFEGEVQLCPDPWHRHPTAANTIDNVARLRVDLARFYPDRTGWWTR